MVVRRRFVLCSFASLLFLYLGSNVFLFLVFRCVNVRSRISPPRVEDADAKQMHLCVEWIHMYLYILVSNIGESPVTIYMEYVSTYNPDCMVGLSSLRDSNRREGRVSLACGVAYSVSVLSVSRLFFFGANLYTIISRRSMDRSLVLPVGITSCGTTYRGGYYVRW